MMKKQIVSVGGGRHMFFSSEKRKHEEDKSDLEVVKPTTKIDKIEVLVRRAIRESCYENIREKLQEKLGESFAEEDAEEAFSEVVVKMKENGSFDKIREDYLRESKRQKEEKVDKANATWRLTMSG